MLKTDENEISGTIRRVGTSNSDYFASSAPATAYPPLVTRSATFPLPSPRSAPLSRPKANTDNAPPSGIQVDPRVKDCSSQRNWPIDRQFVPRPLHRSIDSVKLSQSNKVGSRTEFGTRGKSSVLCTVMALSFEPALMSTKMKDQPHLHFPTTDQQSCSYLQKYLELLIQHQK